MSKEITEIYDLLYRLGATANYTGFFHTAYAVSLCAEHPDRLLLITKWLYPQVAKQYRTNWKAVERNIRVVGNIIWQENRPLLEQLAHRVLSQKPRNAQLLAILAAALNGLLPVHGSREAVTLPGEDGNVGMVDVKVEEAVLNDSGKAAPLKLKALMFDQFQHGYYSTGEKAAQAWNAGVGLMKK